VKHTKYIKFFSFFTNILVYMCKTSLRDQDLQATKKNCYWRLFL